MKEQFRQKRFSNANQELLESIKKILFEFENQGITVTLRQLYYQLVSRDIIPNRIRAYQKLSILLTDARYCGIVDWRAIEDRTRVPSMHPEFDDVPDLIRAAKSSYRLDRWKGQEYYIELWSEKDALSSILAPIASKYHIHLCINRGYGSATAIYNSYNRILENSNDKETIILYLGDHDPSGLDMVRDIFDRIDEFGAELQVEHIALTKEQIKKYKPPPNPAKTTDPRSTGYIRDYGNKSWEVDALRPDVMIKLIENAILDYVDMEMMDKIISKEKLDMRKLEKFGKGL